MTRWLVFFVAFMTRPSTERNGSFGLDTQVDTVRSALDLTRFRGHLNLTREGVHGSGSSPVGGRVPPGQKNADAVLRISLTRLS
jgi:hypothetical protein